MIHGGGGQQLRLLKGQEDSDLSKILKIAVERAGKWADVYHPVEKEGISSEEAALRQREIHAKAIHDCARAAWAHDPEEVHGAYLRTILAHIIRDDGRGGLESSVMAAIAEQNPQGFAIVSKSTEPALRALLSQTRVLESIQERGQQMTAAETLQTTQKGGRHA